MGSRCSRSAARQRGSSSWVTRIRTPGTTAVANCSSNSWTERSSSGSATSHEKSRTSLIRAVASPSRNESESDCPGAVAKSSVHCRRSRSATDRVKREEKLPDGPRRTRAAGSRRQLRSIAGNVSNCRAATPTSSVHSFACGIAPPVTPNAAARAARQSRENSSPIAAPSPRRARSTNSRSGTTIVTDYVCPAGHIVH
jgi:hypothetical protein